MAAMAPVSVAAAALAEHLADHGRALRHAAITANGGSGASSNGGGGGGGRIYISCSNNSFTGTISAFGGGGANWGGAGTVFIQTATPNYQLVLDNGGHPGASTPLSSVSSTDLTLRNGAIGSLTSSLTFGNLLVSSNAWLLISNYSYTVTLSSATIQAGGGIVADAAGYAAGQGPGLGQYYYFNSTYLCSGAGHGGYGANTPGITPWVGTSMIPRHHPTAPAVVAAHILRILSVGRAVA